MKNNRIFRFTVIIAIAAMSVLMLTACKGKDRVPDSERVSDEPFTGNYLITADAAKDMVGKKDVLFVDCRGEKKANKGTVKGAIVTSWQELSTCGEEYGTFGDSDWGKIPAADDFSARLGKLGITKDKELILFAQTSDGWGEDARILWELREAGYENAKIVDGGLNALEAAGVETQNGGSDPVPAKVSIDKITSNHTISTEVLEKNYSDYKVIDVRTEDEWNGAQKYDEAKGGHLPNAILFKYTDLFREDGTLISNKDVEKAMSDAGISKDDKIVTYCTGGIRSAYTQIVLEMCGYKSTYNYDQSFWRWAKVGEVVEEK